MGRAIHALVDGLPADVVTVNDRGLQYGHGMFETCRIVDGCVPLWPYHRARLDQTARRLNIPQLLDPIDAEVAELGATQHAGIIKVPVTAGTGRGYRTDGNAARRIVTVYPPSNSVVDRRIGATVRICRTRLAVQPALAGLKHLNRLEQVLARAEWTDSDIVEGLMCDVDGRLVEGIATNLFLVRGERIVTPNLQRCGVAGVMRRVLIEERPGIDAPIEIRDVDVNELDAADECFLTNAVIGIWPVARVLERSVARLQPGRITFGIMAALEARFGFPGPP
jgi:4-amino-4-deoxychorismate lyase